MKSAYNAGYLALLRNTPHQAASLLHSLEHTVGCIGLYLNADKTAANLALSDKPLKLDHLTCFGNNT